MMNADTICDKHLHRLRVSLLALAATWPVTLKAATDLTDLSLEDLLDVQVTSVSKKPQSLADAAAAVYVISNEDIRRSGATSVPEALKLIARADPLSYGIDAMRILLINSAHYGLPLDLTVLTAFTLIFLGLGSYFFSKIQV